MSYATLTQLEDRYGTRMLIELTDRDTPKTGEIDADVMARALADTDAVIDGYILGRYKLPLAETPPLLADLAAAIAIYKLHSFGAPTYVKEDYDRALSSLDKIGKGLIRLPLEGVEVPSSGASGVQTTDRERPFTEDNLKGWI